MTTPQSRRATLSSVSQPSSCARATGWLAALAAAALVGVAQPLLASQPPQAPTAPAATGQGAAQQTTGAASPAPMRIGETGNVVRVTAPSTQVVLTMTGLGGEVDKMTWEALQKFAETLAIEPTSRLGPPASHTATIRAQRFLGRAGTGALSWLVTVETNLPPNVTERRLTTLALGPETALSVHPLEFTLTNQPPSTAQYDVTAPTHDWLVSRSDAWAARTYPLLIVNRGEPISGLRLALVSLKRSDDGGSIGADEMRLLDRADAKEPAASIDLGPNESRTVFLRLDKSDRLLPYGSFSGQVQLVTNGTAPKGVPLTARVTSRGVRIVGILLVALGLYTSLFITARLQPRLARLLALRPATLLRDAVLKLVTESARLAPGDVDGIVTEASNQAGRLEATELDRDGLLPLAISVAGGVTGDTATKLRARLDEVSGRLAGLMVLRDTIVPLVKQNPKTGRPQHVQTAIDQLNRAAPKATSAEIAEAAATKILEEMSVAARAELGEMESQAAESVFSPIPAKITTEHLDFLLHQTANVAAAIWATVSLAIGVTYILSDVDFGTPVDLLGMFLWGFGLTAFGAGIQQLTPQQVATRIGVTMPKTGATEGAGG